MLHFRCTLFDKCYCCLYTDRFSYQASLSPFALWYKWCIIVKSVAQILFFNITKFHFRKSTMIIPPSADVELNFYFLNIEYIVLYTSKVKWKAAFVISLDVGHFCFETIVHGNWNQNRLRLDKLGRSGNVIRYISETK